MVSYFPPFRRLISPLVISNSHCTKTGISLLVSFGSSALLSLLEISISTLFMLSGSPLSESLYTFPFTPEVAVLAPPQSPPRGRLSLFPLYDEGDHDKAIELVT